MSTISGWVGTGAGVITIGVCVIAAMFVHLLPKFSHPWVHRALIILMYCGATAVLVTVIGQFILGVLLGLAGFLGGVSAGAGFVAIVLASLFLLLTVTLALVKVPGPAAGILAVALAYLLAMVPGGFLHEFYAATAAPGQQAAAHLAAWLGG